MILFRPVGLEELLLIYRSGMRRFPPRLPEQPIFYPVLNADYANQIARDWNAKTGQMAGYVTEFVLDDAYASAFQVHQVGAGRHRELWVPAEELDKFNDEVKDRIRIVAAYFSPTFTGIIPNSFSLRGKSASEQLDSLCEIHNYSLMDFHGEITANHEPVFAHYPYWTEIIAAKSTSKKMNFESLLEEIRRVWLSAFSDIPLGVQASRST